MSIENNDKARIISCLKSDIESRIKNITDLINQTQGLISAVDCAAAETTSGVGRDLIDDCLKISSGLSSALQNMYSCRYCIKQPDTGEEAGDE